MTTREAFPYFRHEHRNRQVRQILELYRDGAIVFWREDKAFERRFCIRQALRRKLGAEAEREMSELVIACADAYILAFGEKHKKNGQLREFSCPEW